MSLFLSDSNLLYFNCYYISFLLYSILLYFYFYSISISTLFQFSLFYFYSILFLLYSSFTLCQFLSSTLIFLNDFKYHIVSNFFLSLTTMFVERREIGWLPCFVYFFDWVISKCCQLASFGIIFAQLDCPLNNVIFVYSRKSQPISPH